MIFLGSDIFSDSSHNRASFRSSYEKMKSFFDEEIDGLDPNDLCLDLFGDEREASAQIKEVQEWIEDRAGSIGDFFIYVATHGHNHRDDGSEVENLSFQVKASSEVEGKIPRGECISWVDLRRRSVGAGQRIYFIIDACHSGIVHRERLTGSAHSYPQIAELESRGAAVLSANAEDMQGVVYAGKEKTPTAFTSVLLEILRHGIPRDHRYGLSLEVLASQINQRMPAWFEAHVTDPDHRQYLQWQIAEASTLSPSKSGAKSKEARLSGITLFANKDPINDTQNFITRQARKATGALKAARDARARLETSFAAERIDVRVRLDERMRAIKEGQQKIEDLEIEIQTLSTMLGEARKEASAAREHAEEILDAEKIASAARVADAKEGAVTAIATAVRQEKKSYRRGFAFGAVFLVLGFGLCSTAFINYASEEQIDDVIRAIKAD